MILIYAYLAKYRNYENASVLFDAHFDVSFREGSLSICRSTADLSAVDLMRKGNVNSIHALVGKTGSGKTNLLQLIGESYEERSHALWNSGEISYFLLYHIEGDEYFLEVCNVDIKQFPLKEESIDNTLPESAKESASRLHRLRTIRFKVTGNDYTVIPEFGRNVQPVKDPIRDRALILNAFDRHSFIKATDENRIGENHSSFIERHLRPYQRASLWSVCECIRDYQNNIETGENKKKISFVLSTHNFADEYPLKLSNALDAEYWTYWENERDAQFVRYDKDLAKKYERYKAHKEKVHPSKKQMFIHDLWTDYAKYLRKWVKKINSYNAEEEIPKDHLDYSGTKDVYQEFADYYSEKEYKEDINPKILPDGMKMKIKMRCRWLAEYIDRIDNRDPHGILWQITGDIEDICDFLYKLDDKYFPSYDRFEVPVVEMEKTQEIFDELFERMEQYHPDDAGIFTDVLLPYEFTCLSTGEYQYAKVLGIILDCLKIHNYDQQGNRVAYDKIILLDEPEAYMHPELARKFLSFLFQLTSKYMDKRNGSIQFVIGTHSPLLVSDLFSEEVTRLDIDKETGYAIVNEGSDKEYFGANMHTILADGFFIDYTIGEYARKKLQDMYGQLKTIAEKKTLSEEDGDFVNEVRSLLPHIGDDFIRIAFDNQLRLIHDTYSV